MADHDEHQHESSAGTDCAAVLAEIYTYLDGELTDEGRTLIASHLGDCNPCLEIFDFEAELRIVIGQRCRDEVPTQLRVRVEQALRRVTLDGGTGPDQPDQPSR